MTRSVGGSWWKFVLIFAVLGVVAAGASAEDGAAVFAKRLAADRELRRSKHPLTVKLICQGATGQSAPVTLSIACGEGDYRVGKLCPVLDGKELPAQVNVLATWPGDQSVKHALISLIVPNLPAKGALTITFADKAPPTPPKFRHVVKPADLTIGCEFDMSGGGKLISRLPATTMKRLSDVLAGKVALGDLAPRLAGPVCYEFELHDTPAIGGKPDADIDIFYRLRFYTGIAGVRIAYVVENTRLPAKPLPKEIALRDRDFTGLRFQAGPTGKLAALAEHGPVTHWWSTRYRVVHWYGDRPPMMLAKQSVAYLVYSQFFPKIGAVDALMDSKVAAALGRKAKVDPGNWPDGRILESGPVHSHMPGTGGRDDIGPYAKWHLEALASESLELYIKARAADGNGLGSFPVHHRDPATLRIGLPHDDPTWPRIWYGFRNKKALRLAPGKTRCPNKPDFAHHPSAGYFSYIATGDKFFQEEMLFWGMRFARWWPFKGLASFGQIRADAWTLRSVVDAHLLLPDGHPRKAYLAARIAASLAALAKAGPQAGRFHTFYEGKRHISGRASWPCSPATSTWQYTWLMWSLDNAARKGWARRAVPLRDWGAKFLIGLYTSKDTFTAPNGRTYRIQPANAMSYNFPLAVETVEWSGGRREVSSDRRHLRNFAEMYYYLMVNTAHQYYNYKREKLDAWVAKLPKKKMRPGDWSLPADVEAKFLARKVGQWHDYGNEPSAAALARSGVSGAEEMYRFVRAAMDHYWKTGRHRGRRNPAIEYVE